MQSFLSGSPHSGALPSHFPVVVAAFMAMLGEPFLLPSAGATGQARRSGGRCGWCCAI